MAQQHIIPTNIIMPQQAANTITRQPLVDQLLDHITSKKLTAIIAPAGYGKTTLLVDTAQQTDLPACWYAVDKLSGNTLHRFSLHLVEAIKLKFPHFGQQTLAYIQNNATLDITTLIALIVNDLHHNINIHFVVIIDDFHLISNTAITDFVNHLLHTITPHCHFIASQSH